jgi:hypothetical protein
MFQNVVKCACKSKIKKDTKTKKPNKCWVLSVIAPGFEPGTYSLEDIF